MVDLVHDDQGLFSRRQGIVFERVHRDLGVGDHHPVKNRVEGPRRVREVGIQSDPHPRSSVGPLMFQVLRGNNHDDAVDSSPIKKTPSKCQREGCFACSRRCNR